MGQLVSRADNTKQIGLIPRRVGLSRNHIEFDYTFANDVHDRWIETDTGWRITLGRGLDIFQKPEDRFTLGFLDQTKRECKGTTIVYSRVRNGIR